MMTLVLALSLQTAQEWMTRFETAVRDAPTMEVEATAASAGEPAGGAEGIALRASISVKRPSRFRMDLSTRFMDQELRGEARCDGTQLASRQVGPDGRALGPVERRDPPERLVPLIALGIARGGVAPMISFSTPGQAGDAIPEDLDRVMEVRDLALDGEETIDDRRTVRLTYTLVVRLPGFPEQTLQERLWLDAESALPVKRNVGSPMMGEMTETYGRFDLGRELPDSHFEVPAEWR